MKKDKMIYKKKLMSDEQALELVKNCIYAVLSLVDPEGNPYCVPISPAYKEGALYFHGLSKGHKLDCIKCHPNVCLSIVGRTEIDDAEYTTWFESATVYGTAERITEPTEFREGLFSICEKYSPDNIDQFDKMLNASAEHTALVKINVTEIVGKVSDKFRKPTL